MLHTGRYLSMPYSHLLRASMLLADKANMRATYHISSYKNTQPSHYERSNRSKKIPHKKFRQPETKPSQKPRRLLPHYLTLVVHSG